MTGALLPGRLRKGVAVTVIFVATSTFLGWTDLFKTLSEVIIWFQFVPSLMKFTGQPGALSGAGFIVVLVLTLIFGRVYCSFLCPLGIFQDMLTRINWKISPQWSNGNPDLSGAVRFAVPLITLVSVVMGTAAVVNLLDPYSVYGRLVVHFLKPFCILFNNLIGTALSFFDNFTLPLRQSHHIPVATWFTTAVSLIFIVVLATMPARMYCNTICPVGALLGLIAKVSLITIRYHPDRCKKCKGCVQICKTQSITLSDFAIDNSRCVACFNCLAACPVSALELNRIISGHSASAQSLARRSLLFGSMSLAAVTWSGVSFFPVSSRSNAITGYAPVLAPGSLSVEHFTANCTSCHLCVSVCPTHALTPLFWQSNLAGVMQPVLDFHRGHCKFTCNECGLICPTGAITPLSLETKKRVRIGTVRLIEEKCIVHVRKIHCGACGEACPTRAISPVEKGKILFPEINTDFCIGCGACEHACPTSPKSIIVTGCTPHNEARQYLSPVLTESEGNTSEDFPF